MDFFMGIFLIPDNDNSREIADTLILKISVLQDLRCHLQEIGEIRLC